MKFIKLEINIQLEHVANFNIKYLDNYPVITFEENIEYPEAVFAGFFHDIIETEEMWGYVFDSVYDNRTKQDIIYEKYTATIIIGRNIDLYKLQGANYVLVTPEYGTSFNAVKFELDVQEKQDNRDLEAKITFYKESEINYPLSSYFGSTFLREPSEINRILFDIDNPPYSFNNVNFYRGASPFQGAFKVPFNDLTNTITVGDDYYLHTDNPTFNALTDISGDNINFATCTAKDADYVYFVCSANPVAPGWDYDVSNVILDHISDGRDLPSGVTISDKTISLVIYTLLEPMFSHESEIKEAGKDAGKQNDANTIEKDKCYFKVFLKLDEIYLAEYLNYALFDDIEISLVNYTNILPSQSSGIITPVSRNNLIDYFEYDINVYYNIKEVGTQR